MCPLELSESCNPERLPFFLKLTSHLHNYARHSHISGRDSPLGGWTLPAGGSKRKRWERRGLFWGNAWKGRRVPEKWQDQLPRGRGRGRPSPGRAACSGEVRPCLGDSPVSLAVLPGSPVRVLRPCCEVRSPQCLGVGSWPGRPPAQAELWHPCVGISSLTGAQQTRRTGLLNEQTEAESILA